MMKCLKKVNTHSEKMQKLFLRKYKSNPLIKKLTIYSKNYLNKTQLIILFIIQTKVISYCTKNINLTICLQNKFIVFF